MQYPERLKRWERYALWGFGVVLVLLGALTAYRTTCLSKRMGDAGVFFRAGWAAREGGTQLYTVTCDNGWHYLYPPLFACLLVPLADAPLGAEAGYCLPFTASVVLWFLLNAGCLLAGLHLLASAVERASPRPPVVGSRRWWSLRSVPLLVCLPCVASTLVRGQVTPILLALICAAFAAVIRGRRFASGVWLAAAVCVKIFPAFLALLPLRRGDTCGLAGMALGLALGLVVLPALVFGPRQTGECYRQLGGAVLGPALGWGDDTSRGAELLDTTACHSQSMVTAFNALIHPDRATRPPQAAPLARRLHWALGGLMTLATLWTFRPKPSPLDPAAEARRTALFGGALVLVMVLVCPVAHLHYFMLAIPAVLALVAAGRGEGVYPGPRLSALLGVHVLTVVLAQLPALDALKDKCLPTYGFLLLWAGTCVAGRMRPAPAQETPDVIRFRPAAPRLRRVG
jgi:alpha-1,2-mannosyltransferase